MATAGQTLDEFRALIGVREQPAGSNNAPPVTDWSGLKDKWCAMACSFVLSRAGIPLRMWGCEMIATMARAGQNGWSWSHDPQVGDLVLFQFDNDKAADHIGMVEAVRPDSIVTIEGNVKDSCARVVRTRNHTIIGFARPPYGGRPAATTPAAAGAPPFPGLTRRGSLGEAVRQVQQRLAARGATIDVDGAFGPQTDRVVRAFQAEKGLEVDGIVGPKTWAALFTA